MKEISSCDYKAVSGGFAQLAAGCAIGVGTHMIGNHFSGNPTTFRGAATSCAIGAFTGGLGGALTRAAGGGAAAWAVHRPAMAGLGFGLNSAFQPHR